MLCDSEAVRKLCVTRKRFKLWVDCTGREVRRGGSRHCRDAGRDPSRAARESRAAAAAARVYLAPPPPLPKVLGVGGYKIECLGTYWRLAASQESHFSSTNLIRLALL